MRTIFSCLIVLVVTSSALDAADRLEKRSYSGATMGTTYSIVAYTNESTIEATRDPVSQRLERINALMSTYEPESELSLFNASRSTEWFDVSEETAVVVARALEICELTDGAFDPTVGPLIRAWHFDAGERTTTPPTDDAIQQLKEHVGYSKIKVRKSPPAIRKADVKIELNLSAIAKGYAVDEATRVLEDHGIKNYFVEIGGEIRAHGNVGGRRVDRPWRAGIEWPEEDRRSILSSVELHDDSLATSGDYRNFFEHDGVKYSHTIDPRTGRPVTHGLASVSVFSADCMTADALATAILVMGPKRGFEFAEANTIEALLVERGGENGYKQNRTAALKKRPVLFKDPPMLPPTPKNFGATQQATNSETPARAVPQTNQFLSMFLISAAVFAIALGGLAVGLIISKKELKGSCGGINGTKDEQGKSICELCTTPPEECDQLREQIAQQAGERRT